MIRKTPYLFVLVAAGFVLMQGCTTKRDGRAYRVYHNTHAKFNGFFYASEALAEAEKKIKALYEPNWDEVLPLFLDTDSKSAQQVYPLMERAIEKSSKVVDKHTLTPSKRDRKYFKRPEMNKWIDDNYTVIGKAYYLKEDDKSKALRSEYIGHVEKMFELFGFKEVKSIASKVMAIETSIARIHWTMVDRRDRDKTYNKLSTEELRKLAPNLNWSFYLEEAGLANEEYFVVSEKSYFSDFSNLFKLTPLEDWKLYLKWKLINSSAGSLNAEIDKQNFAFYGRILNGTPVQEERWKRGTALISGVLGEVVGKIYVERHFQPEAKDRMIELVENLRAAYKEAIMDLDWMSEETKKQALDKLAKFTPKIGYPDKWRDYSDLEVGNNLINNLRQAALFSHQRQIEKLGKPIDRDEWFMNPQTVNAYYNSTMNEIVFPAAILQPPFFNMEADDAVNYGAIGGVIGHEMGHGFDDQGAKSDGDGVLRNWWTENDLEEFKSRTGKLADQYSKFEPLPGEFINGEMTLGENIGDLGGLTIAHKAYKLSLNDQESKMIDGLRGEERFFMGWAQVWAYKFREEALRNRLLTDSHSPAPYRCNGTLMNMPEFVEAYDVKGSDKMYRKPEDRVKIW